MKDSNTRSLVKGVSWRTIGTIDTFLIAYLYFGDLSLAAPIAATEVLTKVLLYYLHERLWNAISWGRFGKNGASHLRSLVKGINWRFIGSMDTMIISFIYSGNPWSSFYIGGTELFTKVALFYFHERLWNSVKWGRVHMVTLEKIVVSKAG
jgi:uncharacterized membrane protein